MNTKQRFILSLVLVLPSLSILFSCSDSVNSVILKSNLPPRPITGPVSSFGYVKMYESDPKLQLVVGGSTDPVDFDPDDGDIVSFEVDSITTINSDATKDQYILDNVQITNAGVFSIVWDDLLNNIEASFTITTDDGKVATPIPPDEIIVILFKSDP